MKKKRLPKPRASKDAKPRNWLAEVKHQVKRREKHDAEYPEFRWMSQYESLYDVLNDYAASHAPKLGRPKGKQQVETRHRVVDAAALCSLNYSQSKMAPLLYPEQHDPEAGRKAVHIFLKRHKPEIEAVTNVMSREQAERFAKFLPRDKNTA